MKKLTLFTFAVFAIVAMTSCKKDRTCNCTYTDPSGSSVHTIVVKKATKKSVKSGACASGTITASSGGYSYSETITCTVK